MVSWVNKGDCAHERRDSLEKEKEITQCGSHSKFYLYNKYNITYLCI